MGLAGLILRVTALLFGFCLLRVAYGFYREGWIFERWMALTFAIWLGASARQQLRRARASSR
jgi:hypothetical protein